MKTRDKHLVLALALLLAAATAFGQELEPVTPVAVIISPSAVIGQLEAAQLPPSSTFRIRGTYLSENEDIWFYRTILKPALLPDGNYADTRNDFRTHEEFLLPHDDPAWSEWQVWDLGNDEIEYPYADLPQSEPDPDDPGQERSIFYLFSAQVMASDGTVSIRRDYGYDVANFRITTSLAPVLAVTHPLIGEWTGAGPSFQRAFDALPGIEGEFTWEANASSYGGQIVSYRWGWDVTDLDDPDDPNWALPPGLSDAHRRAGPIDFYSGVHTLNIRVLDSTGGETILVAVINMVPVPDVQDQLPLLLVDDVVDRNSNGWPDAQGLPRDRDAYRDAFWLDVIDGAGGVAGFDPERDVIDGEVQSIEVRDIVQYRSVVWTARWTSSPNSAIAREFRPFDMVYGPIVRRYVWLGSYQERVGNLLLAGDRAANAFLPESPYVMPVIYASLEGNGFGWTFNGTQPVRVGLGIDPLGDAVYPTLHGYRNLGLAAFDIMSPVATYYTPGGSLLRDKRRSVCAAQKGLALDADFVANHMPGGAAFADTIWTDPVIDWRDQDPAVADDLNSTYLWSNDEFYDADVLGRDTPVVPQDCAGESCLEPLLRSIARYDWNRQRHLAADPDDEWPQDYYGPGEIDAGCGTLALDAGRTSALTNAQVTAFVTHKYEDQKPSQVGDVVMGFDPYRFDHGPMKDALRWVLGEHFGLAMGP